MPLVASNWWNSRIGEPRSIDYHYTTAREMVNIIHAIEDGKTGSPGEYRDYVFPKPSA